MILPDYFAGSNASAQVLDAVLKSTLLLGLTGAASYLLRRASAATRHWVWTLGLVGALLLPVLSLALPAWKVPVLTVEAQGPEAGAPLRGSDLAFPKSREIRTPAFNESRSAAATAAPGNARSDPRALLAAIWLAGALAVLARLAAGLLAVQWMSRRTAAPTDAPWLPLARELVNTIGIPSRVIFLRSERATMPMAWGVVRPAVLMPADAESWPPERLRIVLLHELAHVKRRDCLTHVLAQIACAVYWFNPLVWLAARHARVERERACDDLVLAAGTPGADYADQLLEMARARREARFPALVTGATLAMAHRTQLEGRLISILDPRIPRSRLSRRAATGVAALAACALLPLASIQPWAYSETPAFEPAATYGVESAREPAQGAVQGAARGASQPPQPAQPTQPAAPPAPSERRPADPRTIAALTAALEDSDVDVREAAMHALVQLRDPAVYDALVAALHDSSPDIREQAAMALSHLRDPRSVEPLRSALGDQSAAVREQVVFALGQLRDKETAAAIAQALKDESANVREQAAFALGQLNDKAYVDALAAALKDSSASVREQAAFALGQLRDPRSMEALAAALADVADNVREQAVFALGQLEDPAAVDGLMKALRDAEPGIREQAAFALGRVGESRAVSGLISALKDPDADVRAQAAFALGQLGDRTAVEALVVAMKDTNADVRSQAAFALGRLGDPRAIDALTAALKDANPDVRGQAAFALGQIHR